MGFKDLGKHVPPRAETPDEAALRARAAARHRAKEEKTARAEEHRAGKGEPQPGEGAARREPHE